jgi:FkbM family methyltransferase
MMISYAQNFEDVMLNRVFRDRDAGFYVDVGAADPAHLSVTKAFYDRGWTGINVEPHPELFKKLAEQRPRDINVNCGAGTSEGETTLYEFPDLEWSSLAPEVSRAAPGRPGPIAQRQVAVTTLTAILDKHAGGRTIDFLKIDVEGWEKDVLQGTDLKRYRPTIILLEAVDRHTQKISSDWEDDLFAADYKFIYFDGLNKFYAGREHEGIEKHFAVPPNVFDDFRLCTIIEQQKQVHALVWANRDSDRASHAKRIEMLTTQLGLFETDRASHLGQIHTLTDHIHDLQKQLAASESDRTARLEKINRLTELLAAAEVEQSRRFEQIRSLSSQLAQAQTAAVATEGDDASEHAKVLLAQIQSLERAHGVTSDSLEQAKAELARYRGMTRIGPMVFGFYDET